MDKEAIMKGIAKAVTEAITAVSSSKYKLTAVINAINTSVRITFVDGKHGRHSLQFNIEDDGLLSLHNIRLPDDLIHKGIMTKALEEIRKIPGLNGYCHVAFALNMQGWKTILQRAGFKMI